MNKIKIIFNRFFSKASYCAEIGGRIDEKIPGGNLDQYLGKFSKYFIWKLLEIVALNFMTNFWKNFWKNLWEITKRISGVIHGEVPVNIPDR